MIAGTGAAGAAIALSGRSALAQSLRAAPDSPAVVIHGGRIWTGTGPVFDGAVAIGRGGLIQAVGLDAEIQPLVGRDTQVIDAAGATVMPGIHDGHAHPLGAASDSLDFSLEDVPLTTDELLGWLQEMLDSTADGEPDAWLSVQMWNVTTPSDNVPHRRFLDSLSTGRPIYLHGSDGHNSWVNSRALEIAGIDASTPQPDGGEIVMDDDGPTGVLLESAQRLVRQHLPEVTPEELRAAEAEMFALLASNGVTTFLDAAGSADSMARYGAHLDAGTLLQRVAVNFTVGGELLIDPDAALAAALAARGEHGGHRLWMPSIKVFMDGILEFPHQTASLLAPYVITNNKGDDYRGEQYLDSAQMGALSSAFAAAGWQVHTHAIGDAAVRTTLDGYAAAIAAAPDADLRHTIAHLQLVDPTDIPRFAELGVLACMQLQWAVRDEYTVDAVERHIGSSRHRWMYPAGSIEAAGGFVCGGSDWPVDVLNSWNQVQTAIDRVGDFSTEGIPLYPEEGLSLDSSLAMHSTRSAHQLHLEGLTGTLEPGKVADLIVLDRDLHGVDVSEISSTQVRYTFVDGQAVHEADGSGGAAGLRRRAEAKAAARRRHVNPSKRHRHCCDDHRH